MNTPRKPNLIEEPELRDKLIRFIIARDHMTPRAKEKFEQLSFADLTRLEMQARGAVISEQTADRPHDGTRSGDRIVPHVVTREPRAMFTSDYDTFDPQQRGFK
jgi:hypothetical protein